MARKGEKEKWKKRKNQFSCFAVIYIEGGGKNKNIKEEEVSSSQIIPHSEAKADKRDVWSHLAVLLTLQLFID